jgi:hypothetical protein
MTIVIAVGLWAIFCAIVAVGIELHRELKGIHEIMRESALKHK